MEPMYAAGQRGKRTVALDLKAPDAATVLERLFRWADVVHHNSRLGLAERLGYDEATVRAANPHVIYSFASGFGESGPRAPLPANDHLMQALSGVEATQGGHGSPPTFLAWGAIDVASGWLSAIAMLAGLYARRQTGSGHAASTSRSTFTAGFVDDPVNEQLGRIVRHKWGERGLVDQPAFPPRIGPEPRPGAGAYIAGLGEHTTEVLAEVGLDAETRATLAASGTIAG